MSDNGVLSGKVAIVTGGCKGVGKGISQVFLEAGAQVVICCRNEPAELPTGGGRTARFVQADVRDDEAVANVIKVATDEFGSLDVLVNNAGGAPYSDAAKASTRFSTKVIQLNLVAPLVFATQAYHVMSKQAGGGSIINIASVSGRRPSPGTAAYGAAKAGLLSLTQSLAVEWAPKVRVNAIVAGLIRTEQSHLHYGDEAGIERVSKTVPLGRMGTPQDIGNVCRFLASDASAYVTGAELLVHGGGEWPAFLTAAQNK